MEKIKTLLKKIPGATKLYMKLINMPTDWQIRQKAPSLRQSYRNPAARARVFITGDMGHLGLRVANYLKTDYEVVGFDMKADPQENLSNYKLLKKRMAGCQFVVHAAAIPTPNKGTIDDYFKTNVLGSFNVMRAAATNNVKRFIYFSSVGYYGCNVKGKLLPAYFPIDEVHPIASVKGRAEGMLDNYNQSKVMSEELLVWYGTNRIFQAISFRIGPANKKANQYPLDKSWRKNPSFRRAAFWVNCDPDSVPQAVEAALKANGEFWYEPFNICDKYTVKYIDVKAFLTEEYPDVPVKCNLSDNPSLISPAKAEQVLGFKPGKDLK